MVVLPKFNFEGCNMKLKYELFIMGTSLLAISAFAGNVTVVNNCSQDVTYSVSGSTCNASGTFTIPANDTQDVNTDIGCTYEFRATGANEVTVANGGSKSITYSKGSGDGCTES